MLTELPKVRFIVSAKQGLLYACSISQIWCLQAIDVAKQRKVLVDAKKFELALKLTVSINRLYILIWVLNSIYNSLVYPVRYLCSIFNTITNQLTCFILNKSSYSTFDINITNKNVTLVLGLKYCQILKVTYI